MIKQISLIVIVAIGIVAVFIRTSHAAFATVPGGCSGDPHGQGVNPATGDPHIGGLTGNPHLGFPGCPGG